MDAPIMQYAPAGCGGERAYIPLLARCRMRRIANVQEEVAPDDHNTGETRSLLLCAVPGNEVDIFQHPFKFGRCFGDLSQRLLICFDE